MIKIRRIIRNTKQTGTLGPSISYPYIYIKYYLKKDCSLGKKGDMVYEYMIKELKLNDYTNLIEEKLENLMSEDMKSEILKNHMSNVNCFKVTID
jgi:hypothetical protein